MAAQETPTSTRAAVDVLASYAQDTGAFRVTNKAATELADACAAVAELIERLDLALRGEDRYFVVGTDGVRIREIRITQDNLDCLKVALARVRGGAQ